MQCFHALELLLAILLLLLAIYNCEVAFPSGFYIDSLSPLHFLIKFPNLQTDEASITLQD